MITLIQSFNNVDSLHTLLTSKDKQQKTPLQYISAEIIQKNPEMINAVGAALRKAYAGKPDQLRELSDSLDSSLHMIILRPEPRRIHGFLSSPVKSEQTNHTKHIGGLHFKN